MRPHQLRLSAFGPFPGVVEVDHDRLGASGLFLLHGPTGAGKSSLLDGMCFALYGRVPGARSVSRLRSDHAPADAVCEVSLELTVGRRRLRVTRSPAQERAKKRGCGTTRDSGAVRLQELRGGRWQLLSTRPDEVGAELGQLLGMSADQFWQVVLLPQGQFAEFLRADAAKRGDLLEALFRCDRFRDAESWLGDLGRTLAARVEAASAEVRSLADRVAEAAGAAGNEMPALGWYETVLTTVTAVSAAAAQDVVRADAAAARAAAALQDASTLADRQRRRRAARDTLAALEARAAAMTEARGRLDAARRAEPLLEQAARVQTSAAAAADADVTAHRLLAGLDEDADGPRPRTVAALRTEADRQRGRVGGLEMLAQQASRLAAALARIDAADIRLAQIAVEFAALDDRRVEAPARRRKAEAALRTAQQAARDLPAAELRVGQETVLAAAAHDREAVRTRVGAASRADAAAREAALAAGERRLMVREALLAGQAARFAAELVDGHPCAVCGSAQHPAPATGAAAAGEAELTAAEEAVTAAHQAQTGTAAALAMARAELATLNQQLAGWTPTLDAATAEHGRLAAAAATLSAAEVAVLGCDRADHADATAEARLTSERSARTTARAAAAQDAAADRAAVTAAIGDADDLAAAIDRATRRAQLAEAAADARADADRRTAQAAAEHEALAAALTARGFADSGALHQAALSDPTGLEASIGGYDAQLAAVRSSLADPELAVALEPAADLTTVGVEHAEALRVRDVLTAVAAVAAERQRAVAGHGPALGRALSALKPLRAERELVSGLAELAGGRNSLGMTLTTYVLAARLEEVAAAASRRLVLMSDGRYTLHHTDERRDGRRRSGLGLAVHDAWTGQARDTGTLSGGETFVTSLALALGLADTVTAEAGGTPIEALFVDEGFGTLDPETLDEVMDVLDGLRAGGRVVGLVSHVAELRQRVPAQLRVLKQHDGSTVEVVA